jgi:hypothetical protein
VRRGIVTKRMLRGPRYGRESGEFVASLDMAYPVLKLAVEYEGRSRV